MFNDPDENLPDWFVKEEQYHMRKLPEVDPKAVEYYKDKQNDIGVKTIKKVVEAKARKKRKIAKKMEKAKNKKTIDFFNHKNFFLPSSQK